MGDLLYEAGNLNALEGRLRVWDVSNTSFPRVVSLFLGNQPRDVVVRGGVASVVGRDGLKQVDVSNPGVPRELGSYVAPGLFDLAVSGHHLFASLNRNGRAAGLEVVDFSVPEAPRHAASIDTFEGRASGRPRDIVRRGDLLYMAHKRTGLRVFDVGDPDDPEEVGDRDVEDDPDERVSPGARGLGIENGFAVVARGRSHGLDVVDVSDPGEPEVVGHLEGRWIADDVVVREGIAYVGLSREIATVGVWDPTRPVELARVQNPGNSPLPDVELDGLRLHAGFEEGTWVLDVSDPEKPRRMLGVPAAGIESYEGIAVDNDLVYAASEWVVRIYDYGPELAEDPPHPSGCGAQPRDACLAAPGGALLKLRRSDGKLRFRWRSNSSSDGEAAVFGDPDADTGYGLCVYDTRDSLVWRAAMPSGTRWSADEDGFRYRSTSRGPHGMRSAKLSGDGLGLRGRASIKLPLGSEGRVVAQVVSQAGDCWEARFSADPSSADRMASDTRRFRAVVRASD